MRHQKAGLVVIDTLTAWSGMTGGDENNSGDAQAVVDQFDQIVDERNAPPVVRIFEPTEPTPYLSIDLDVYVPSTDDMKPRVGVDNFEGVQPHKIVYVGEKSSLADVLGPVATEYRADLYLPTGEISDTLLWQMAKIGADDDHRMVVLYFSDCDPSGWQMPISLCRKLQGL